MERLLLHVQQAAELLQISRSQVYAMIARGDLPSIRIGRAVRIPSDALAAWVASQTVGA